MKSGWLRQLMVNTGLIKKHSPTDKFMLVEGALLKQCLDGEHFAVTRKVDGHLQVLFYEGTARR